MKTRGKEEIIDHHYSAFHLSSILIILYKLSLELICSSCQFLLSIMLDTMLGAWTPKVNKKTVSCPSGGYRLKGGGSLNKSIPYNYVIAVVKSVTEEIVSGESILVGFLTSLPVRIR